MSGGTFDYIQYRLQDVVEEIKERISRNGKTVQQVWDEMSDMEQQDAPEWEKPWTFMSHPWHVDSDADNYADKELGVDFKTRPFDSLSEDEKKKWNQIRKDYILRQIKEYNASVEGSDYSKTTVAQLQAMLETIQKAAIYIHRIDWLFAGDDGEDNFLERTKEDLEKEGLS